MKDEIFMESGWIILDEKPIADAGPLNAPLHRQGLDAWKR
jgi:hypothetical protein